MEQIWKSLEDVKKMMEMIYGTREFMGHMDDCRTLLPISVGHLKDRRAHAELQSP